MVKYDARIIQQYAQQLYSWAFTIVVCVTIAGAFFGAGAGAGVVNATVGPNRFENAVPIAALAGMIFGGFIGWVVGQSMAFGVRLRAQLALCQAQIERNTRHTHATLYAMLPQQSQGSMDFVP